MPGLHVADDLVRGRILRAICASAAGGTRSRAACVLLLLRRSQSRLRGFPDLQLRMNTNCLASHRLRARLTGMDVVSNQALM